MKTPLALSLVLVAVATTGLRAQDMDEPYLALGVTLGFGGEVEAEFESARAGGVTIDPEDNPTEAADTEVAFGGVATYMYPLHRYFALGGRFALQSWHSSFELDGGRNLVFDLALVPQVRVPLTDAVEIYLSIPLGVSLDLFNQIEDAASFEVFFVRGGASIEASPGFGFNLAALLGARFALGRALGLFAELGYSMRSVSHDLELRGGAAGVGAASEVEVALSWWQVAVNAGVYF